VGTVEEIHSQGSQNKMNKESKTNKGLIERGK
jgi:hypothetical protein